MLLMLLGIIYADVLKVYRNNHNFFTADLILINRELICTRTFEKNREKHHFNSFILGSSRSQAFKCKDWEPFIGETNKAFHFDGYGSGLYNIHNQLRYIDKLGDSIKNALIIIDRHSLTITENRYAHLTISPPCLSNQSKIDYYKEVTKFQLSNNFFREIYKNLNHLKSHSLDTTYRFVNDTINCDSWYSYEQYIKADSAHYYSEKIKQNIFYERPVEKSFLCNITTEEVLLLKNIFLIFSKHNTNFKIVISPIYNQIPLEMDQLQLLQKIFGKENIYDFSGVNKYTEPLHNYYEASHFRPHVAKSIMQEIY